MLEKKCTKGGKGSFKSSELEEKQIKNIDKEQRHRGVLEMNENSS